VFNKIAIINTAEQTHTHAPCACEPLATIANLQKLIGHFKLKTLNSDFDAWDFLDIKAIIYLRWESEWGHVDIVVSSMSTGKHATLSRKTENGPHEAYTYTQQQNTHNQAKT
jgi:hypothetical protein